MLLKQQIVLVNQLHLEICARVLDSYVSKPLKLGL